MSVTLTELALVAAGGALGAAGRFGIGRMALFADSRWYVTAGINVAGSMLIGILWALFSHFDVSRQWYLLAVTGFLGGFTTYSAFSLDTVMLVHDGRVAEGALCAFLTLAGCLTACAAGLYVTEKLLKLI